ILDSPLDGRRRIVSLWDMIEFYARDALRAVTDIADAVNHAKSLERSEPFNRVHRDSISKMLKSFDEVCSGLNLTESISRMKILKTQLGFLNRTAGEYFADLEGLQRSFMREVCGVHFAFIPKEKIKYFEKDGDEALFGWDVFANFESARDEIKNAGNCLAADLHTA